MFQLRAPTAAGVSHLYRFRSVWTLAAPVDAVLDVVTDPGSYPLWWPDVYGVSRVDDDTAEVVCRSVLPYALVFRLHRSVRDDAVGLLRVDMSGDLEGVCSSTVRERSGLAELEITQDVVVNKRLLRLFSPVARPVFEANHAVMMWRGQRGLRRFLGAA